MAASSNSNSSPLRLMRSCFSPFFQFRWASSTSASSSSSQWFFPGSTASSATFFRNFSSNPSSSSSSSSSIRSSVSNSCSSRSIFRRYSCAGGSSIVSAFPGSAVTATTMMMMMPPFPVSSMRHASSFLAQPTDAEKAALRKLTDPVDWTGTGAARRSLLIGGTHANTSREALTSSKQRLQQQKARQKRTNSVMMKELPLGDKTFLQRFVSANRTAAAPDELGAPITPREVKMRLDKAPADYKTPRGKLQPQLAVPWESVEHNYTSKDELMVSLKLDGVRCVIRSSNSGKLHAFSRHGKEFCFAATPLRRILDALQPLFDKYPKLVLDGEVYAHRVEFGDLCGAVRNETSAMLLSSSQAGERGMPKSLASMEAQLTAAEAQRRVVALQEKIQFFAFDIAAWDRIDVRNTPYADRMKLLHRLLKSTLAAKHFAQPGAAIQLAPAANSSSDYVSDAAESEGAEKQAVAAAAPAAAATDTTVATSFPIPVTGREGLRVLHSQFVDCASQQDKPVAFLGSVWATKAQITSCRSTALGGHVEGIMIRPPASGYTYGRNQALMKHKLMHDAEFKVVGFVPGKGVLTGAMGALMLKTSSGEQFRAAYGGTIKEKIMLWKMRDQLMGKLVTVQYQELTERGVPRFPIVKGIRGKAKNDCI